VEDAQRTREELIKELAEARRRIAEIEESGNRLKKAEEVLRKSEKKLRDITSSLGEGIYVLTESGGISFMNEEAERLLGWTHQELRDKIAHTVVHYRKADGTPLPAEECPLHRVIKTRKRFVSTDEVFVRKDGTLFPASVITTPIIEDGKVVASVTAFRDITERKRLENELLKIQELDSLGYLAGGIAHDFNNLLQAILGNISLAKLYCEAGDKIHQWLTEAENASLQATNLSHRLLTFSKGGTPHKKTTSISGLLKDAVKFALSGSKVICEFDFPADCYRVEVDEGQMIQVIHNLVMNAGEAMPEGGVIKVSARNVQGGEEEGLPMKEGNYLRISIEDRGAGIPDENLTRIFDPYFTTKDYGVRKGKGLGLSICHSIIKKHDGLITVESEVGAGTTFNLYLPAAETSAAGSKTPANKRGNKHILLMDDEEAVRTISREILEYLGYEVVVVSEGSEAVAIYNHFREAGKDFCAIILDLTIPGGMGGEKVMRKILEMDPSAKGIVSSGYADDPILKQFREQGFSGALAKPYTVEQMRKALRDIAC